MRAGGPESIGAGRRSPIERRARSAPNGTDGCATAGSQFAGALLADLRAVRPDLIHAHSSKAGAIARVGRILHPQVPVIYTPHGYAFNGFFENELERFVYRQTERALAQLTSFVIAVCGAEAKLACTVGPVRRVRVVHNGIGQAPTGPGDPRVLELTGRGPVICTLTQLRPGKGVETLIDALPPVLAHDPRVQVALVGDGPLRESLMSRARSVGVAHAVHFLGEHGDPIAVLRAADIFVLPSWAEAFPYVMLEAMSVGLPIVATRVGGIPEALTDNATGLIVAPRDPLPLARALIELLADRELRVRLGDAATRMVTKFSLTTMVDGVTGVPGRRSVRVRAAPRRADPDHAASYRQPEYRPGVQVRENLLVPSFTAPYVRPVGLQAPLTDSRQRTHAVCSDGGRSDRAPRGPEHRRRPRDNSASKPHRRRPPAGPVGQELRTGERRPIRCGDNHGHDLLRLSERF